MSTLDLLEFFGVEQDLFSSQAVAEQKPSTSGPKRRKKYSRPCDYCGLRKVRCSGGFPCTRCVNKNVPCTSNRVRKKCGPKTNKTKENKLNKKSETQTKKNSVCSTSSNASTDSLTSTSESWAMSSTVTMQSEFSELSAQSSAMSSNIFPDISFFPELYHNQSGIVSTVSSTPDYFESPFRNENLIACLEVFQNQFHSIWPVVSGTNLITKVHETDFQSDDLGYDDSLTYALILSIGAAVSCQLRFVPQWTLANFPNDINAEEYSQEALKIRNRFRHDLSMSPDSLLTSFFLYICSMNMKDGLESSVKYFKEAISLAQNLGLYDTITYLSKSPFEAHKI